MPDVPYRVEKPWGHELIWARTDRYVGKILHIEQGQQLLAEQGQRKGAAAEPQRKGEETP